MPPPVWSVWIFYIDLKPPTAAPVQTESPNTVVFPLETHLNIKSPLPTNTVTNIPTIPPNLPPTIQPSDHSATPCAPYPDMHLGTSHTANKDSVGVHLTSAALTGICGLSPRRLSLTSSDVSLDLLDCPLSSPTNSGMSTDVLRINLPYTTSAPSSPVSLTSSVDVLEQKDQANSQPPLPPSQWAAQTLPAPQATCWERQDRLLQDGDIESNPGPPSGASTIEPPAW